MTIPSSEAESPVTVSIAYAYEGGLAEGRRESAERLKAAEALAQAVEYWSEGIEGHRNEAPIVAIERLDVALAHWRELTK